jgi:hypothetical protein
MSSRVVDGVRALEPDYDYDPAVLIDVVREMLGATSDEVIEAYRKRMEAKRNG